MQSMVGGRAAGAGGWLRVSVRVLFHVNFNQHLILLKLKTYIHPPAQRIISSSLSLSLSALTHLPTHSAIPGVIVSTATTITTTTSASSFDQKATTQERTTTTATTTTAPDDDRELIQPLPPRPQPGPDARASATRREIALTVDVDAANARNIPAEVERIAQGD